MTQEKTGGYWIYRPWFTTKDGRKIYAKNYGKRLLGSGLRVQKERTKRIRLRRQRKREVAATTSLF